MGMCKRLATFFATWSATLLLAQGCGVETPNCTAPKGDYRPAYALVQGNCGEIANPYWIPVEVGANGAPVTRTISVNDSMISTEVIMKGCAMRMTQSEVKAGKLRAKIDGDSINIGNTSALTGMVVVNRWDELGNAACAGVYNATLVRNETSTAAGTGTPVAAGTH
jgi:hypothetical protein